jgi:hypothetical protein
MDQPFDTKRLELRKGDMMDRCEVMKDPRVVRRAFIDLDDETSKSRWPSIDLTPGVFVKTTFY